jgi:hypothetical protein
MLPMMRNQSGCGSRKQGPAKFAASMVTIATPRSASSEADRDSVLTELKRPLGTMKMR